LCPAQLPGAPDPVATDGLIGINSNDCVDLFAWLRSPQPLDQPVTLGYDEQVDGDHGRSEIRRVWSTPIPEGLESCARWPGLTSAVMVESIRQLGEAESVEQRYYISSLPGTTQADAQRANRVIRTHWEIENRVHWVLDVAMGEDILHAALDETFFRACLRFGNK
jgi:predicted transposase YbfD/YdcC